MRPLDPFKQITLGFITTALVCYAVMAIVLWLARWIP